MRGQAAPNELHIADQRRAWMVTHIAIKLQISMEQATSRVRVVIRVKLQR